MENSLHILEGARLMVDTPTVMASASNVSVLVPRAKASLRADSATLAVQELPHTAPLKTMKNNATLSTRESVMTEAIVPTAEDQPNPDDALVLRVQQGDKKAFDLLVLKYQYKVQAIVNRFVRDVHEAQDVAQETFIKAYRALPNFRGDSQFYTWLYRIAVNTSKNHLVSRGRRPPSFDVDADDAEFYAGSEALRDNSTPESRLATDQLETAIYEALDRLPEDLRTAITLREMDGLSYEDIALTMDCPIGTVRSRIFRAREAIDKHIGPLIR